MHWFLVLILCSVWLELVGLVQVYEPESLLFHLYFYISIAIYCNRILNESTIIRISKTPLKILISNQLNFTFQNQGKIYNSSALIDQTV